ncbi:hypothetical protein [Ekhidna sp.]
MTRIFKPTKADAWTKFAKEIGGEYVDGGPTENDILKVTYKKWTILLYTDRRSENYTVTIMKVSFLHKKKLKLHISAKGYLSKLLGINGISIGNKSFEKEYILKSNSIDSIMKLIESKELMRLLMQNPYIKLKTIIGRNGWFGLSYPPEISVIHLEYPGEVLERAVLRDLSKLFSVLLDRLVEIDAAHEKNPNFTL